ncbi:alpha/beta fold hydrolase [Nonomuraea sp. NPDC048892]|uniref:alpha/beta fold hydrolase n=1 Tax=Nonomuraea sp. NPDC048892 TaxID=3154624 RepID=UPI0033C1D37B
MNRATATGVALGALLTSSLAGTAPAVAETQDRPALIVWQQCPAYSDDELRSRGLKEKQFATFRQLLGRAECGALSVPQDYAAPGGTQITIALTRLKATDQKRRIGSLAFNPGGPGGSGYLMPIELVTKGVPLDERHDLIGFDPRGVGHSTKTACALSPGERQIGPVTEEQARRAYDETVARNQACARSSPAFLRQLTAANAARDLDRLRAALGEPKISFYGISWGTWLGAVLRSLYGDKVHRMWLDSVAPPDRGRDHAAELRAVASDRVFRRMTAWIAERDDTYGLGTSREQVVSALTAMRKSLDAEPLTFTDPGLTVDGGQLAEAAGRSSVSWPDVAQAFQELADAKGPTAPPAVRKVFGGGSRSDGSDRTANLAYVCNEDSGSRAFEPAWKAYQQRVQRYPVTGRSSAYVPTCAGWPPVVDETSVKRGGGSLMLSGHRYETLAPYEGTLDMHETIGGTLVTIDDDVHGSAARVPGCITKIVDYFETGRRTSTCPGSPLPS